MKPEKPQNPKLALLRTYIENILQRNTVGKIRSIFITLADEPGIFATEYIFISQAMEFLGYKNLNSETTYKKFDPLERETMVSRGVQLFKYNDITIRKILDLLKEEFSDSQFSLDNPEMLGFSSASYTKIKNDPSNTPDSES